MTVAEILLQSGLSQEQVAALDAKVLAGFNGVLTTAEQEKKKAEEAAAAAKAAQDAAELQARTNKEWWDTQVNPSLTQWEEQQKALQQEVANAKALAAFYEAQNKAAKESGFIAQDAPAFNPAAVGAPVVPARAQNGQFVAGAPGATPGSPVFKMEDVENRIGQGLDNSVWALQEYQRLTGGQFLPDSVSTLAQEAHAQKLRFKDYVARKYDFQGKQAALQAKAEQEKADRIRAEAVAPYEQKIKEKEAEWQKKLEEKVKEVSERGGNNPDVRRAAISQYPEVKKAVAEGVRKDPTMMTKVERQQQLHKSIHEAVLSNEEAKQGAAA